MIFLACTPKQESWDDKDGNKRSAIKFNIDRFSFVGGKKDESQGIQNKPAQQQPTYNISSDASFASDSIPF
jgi:single-stranded DNA-binding protein